VNKDNIQIDLDENIIDFVCKKTNENESTISNYIKNIVYNVCCEKEIENNNISISIYSVSKDDDLRAIRHEEGLTLELLCEAVTRSIKQKGHFYLCHTPSRFTEIVVALYSSKLEIKKIRFCRHTASSLPFLVLIDAVYLGGKGVTVMPDFIVQDEAGNYTEEMKKMIERGCI